MAAEVKQLDQSVHLSPAEMRMDPFSPREGKELAWKGVNMTLVCCDVIYDLRRWGDAFVLLFSISVCVRREKQLLEKS